MGAGQVAKFYARRFASIGLQVIFIAGRDRLKVKSLAAECRALAVELGRDVLPPVDLIICAVKDDAIQTVTATLAQQIAPATLVVHTSGSQPMAVISSEFKNRGVFYPLQTSNTRDEAYDENIPIVIESAHQRIDQKLAHLAGLISKTVVCLESEQRLALHLSAVILNNFTNHLAARAFHLLRSHQLDPQILYPLLIKTSDMIMTGHPEDLQTGPAKRFDTRTLDLHRNYLSQEPELLAIYDLLTKSIQTYS